jgi:hypothetical protein
MSVIVFGGGQARSSESNYPGALYCRRRGKEKKLTQIQGSE